MTLIELMVALVIVGVLTNFALIYYGNVKDDAQVAKIKNDLSAIKSSIAAYMSDQYNLKRERPTSLSQMVLASFTVVNADDSTDVKIYKRSFIEAIPKNPWGPDYYADLFYVCAKNPLIKVNETDPATGLPRERNKTLKAAYTSPTADNFGAARFSTKFYRSQVVSGASVSVRTGEVALSVTNGASANSAALLTTVNPVTITQNPKDAYIFEFNFEYIQTFADNPVISTNENRVLESSAPEVFKNASNGMVFLYKNKVPAFGPEVQVMTGTGVGFKFSAEQWELYHSPTGGAASKLMSGGMDPGSHSIRFVFRKDVTYVDCYLDGDLKATARLGPSGSASHKVYPLLSPDMFTDVIKVADCKMLVKQIVINSVDFSDYYDDFIIPCR